MPCENPVQAYRAPDGGPIHFTRPQQRTYEELQLPCGTCILCRQEQARQWAVRITHEAQQWDISSFVTLSYDDENLPTHSSLNYRHLQLFWKRLRKKVGRLRYYAVGEYGDETNRPHYHACIFGHAFTEDRIVLRTTPSLLWTSPMLQSCWSMGHVAVGALTFETARYTASYVTKKLRSKQQYVRLDVETGELIPLVQPRAFMSLRPAIGREWLDRHGDQTYAHDHVIVNGQRHKPPKYYDLWLERRSVIAKQMITERRKQQAVKRTAEQTHARAENARARARSKSKSI